MHLKGFAKEKIIKTKINAGLLLLDSVLYLRDDNIINNITTTTTTTTMQKTIRLIKEMYIERLILKK